LTSIFSPTRSTLTERTNQLWFNRGW